MYSQVKKHIPQFIIEKYLLYADIFTDCNKEKEKSCLILTKQLKFFEYKYKELINSIDLQQSCLNKVKTNCQNYQGPYSKIIDCMELEKPTSSQSLNISETCNVNFGKYIFYFMDIQRTYILIQCWDKFIVLERLNNCKGFQLVKEYENFHSYKLIPGDPIKYCAMIEIKFQNSTSIRTDFQNVQISHPLSQSPELLEECSNSAEFKDLLERICSARSELNIHENITSGAFQQLKERLTYGLPYLRSIKPEEKQMLARCGDIWKRLTPQNHLVIGVPLINQCCPPNLTVLKNLQPTLQINSCNEEQKLQSLSCEYRLYQLQQQFHDLDSLEIFLRCDSNEHEQQKTKTDNIWFENHELELLPNSFGVLVIKYHLKDIIHLNECPLYINYQVCKDYATNPLEESVGKIYPLQIFVQTVDFRQICFAESRKYEIKFCKETMQQDFLAIVVTSVDLTLKCTFNCFNDYNIFIELLQEKYDLNKISKQENDLNADVDMMNFSNTTTTTIQGTSNLNFLLYNSKPNSLWYSLLLLQLCYTDNCLKYHGKNCTHNNDDDDNNSYTVIFKFYLPNEEKSLIFLRSLHFDLISDQCNVVKIEKCRERDIYSYCKLANFEHCLSQELKFLEEFLQNRPEKNSPKWLEQIEHLFKLQLATDLSKCYIDNE